MSLFPQRFTERILRPASIYMLCAFCLLACEDETKNTAFESAKGQLDQVIAETFDDSFSDPAFAKVKAAFEAVSEDDKDYLRAQEYIKRIDRAFKPCGKKSRRFTDSISAEKDESTDRGLNKPEAKSEPKSAQRKAYDKAIGDFKKAEKVREKRLKEVMKEINTMTETDRGRPE